MNIKMLSLATLARASPCGFWTACGTNLLWFNFIPLKLTQTTMWAIGQSLLITNWVADPLGLLAFVLIYLFRVKHEEQQLLDQFGAEYKQYQKRTGRLLPKFICER